MHSRCHHTPVNIDRPNTAAGCEPRLSWALLERGKRNQARSLWLGLVNSVARLLAAGADNPQLHRTVRYYDRGLAVALSATAGFHGAQRDVSGTVMDIRCKAESTRLISHAIEAEDMLDQRGARTL